jgi:hypothetical protein
LQLSYLLFIEHKTLSMKKFTLSLIIALSVSLIISNAASAQIAQRGSSTNGTSTNTSLTINKPTGVVAGDVMIVNIGQRNNGTTAPLLSGWTPIASGVIDGGTTMGALLYKVAGGSEPTSYTFTLGSGADNNEGTIVAFSGVDVSGSPFDVAPGSLSLSAANGSTVTATGITTVTANAAVIMFAQSNDNQSMGTWNSTSPGTLTELYEDQYNASGAVDLTLGAAWAIKATAGATGNGTMTLGSSIRWGAMLIALKPIIPTPTATLTPSAAQNIAVGGTVSFTATANNYSGSGNYTYTWTATGATIPGSNPNSIAASSDSKTLTFPSSGTYTVSVTIARTGETTHVTNTTTVTVLSAPATPNLWAASSNGSIISGFSVSSGVYFAGPTTLFTPTFPGTTTGGTSTAAIGRNASPNPANGYFYWLPNTSGNSGVVEVFAATATGGTPTRIGSFDVNGASNNSLGFVRLGMGPDGTGWILAGDGTTLYIAYFASNGVNPVTINTKSVSLVGGAVATFQNGDVCVSGNNNMYALANDGSGVTQVFIGTLSNPTVTLTKKWDLVDPANAPFTGSVNGVAFDVLGSLYLTTADGLYYINQATVNGPAGTVQCSLVQSQTGLQDLASNVFPQQSSLPVKIGNFTVNKQGDNAVLDWTTSTELNSDHFEIERSYDGVNFTNAGNKQASGNSATVINYQYLDPLTIRSGNIYYRLKTVDIDGGFTYSKIVVLRLSGSIVKGLTVYPNPFINNLKLQISSDKEIAATIRIINALGQTVVNRTVILQKGENTVVFSTEVQNLKPGIHLLEIITEGEKMTLKIIKR